MRLNDYQDQARSFRMKSADETYALLNISGEVGELLSIYAKGKRDGFLVGYRDLIAKELGDILWHIAAIADDEGMTLNDIAQLNINKLSSRKERNVLTGSGDNR